MAAEGYLPVVVLSGRHRQQWPNNGQCLWPLKSGLLHITRHFTVEIPQKHHQLYKPFDRCIEIFTPEKNIFFIDNVVYIIDLHTSYSTKSCG